MTVKLTTQQRRKFRVRNKIRKVAAKNSRPRLSVHRTERHMHAQLIDDARGLTIAAASTMQPDVSKGLKSTSNIDAAKAVGKAIAERAKKAGIESVVFDRGAFLYHGRVKAVADAAREAGLQF